ncbi:trefoil factor 3 [Fukomys damarensis]|uniref:trefoil factor 3 n=1 Tax=Fukomys damarensis TaxID=885580 RepID=UPI0005402C69|nr:trefoil factor 3 [Fukomys damarensis]
MDLPARLHPCQLPRSAYIVMETRAFCLLLLVMALGSSGWANQYVGLSPNQCVVPPKERVDCGYPKVTQEQCQNRGCCFDSSVPQVPWCFKPLQETECTF